MIHKIGNKVKNQQKITPKEKHSLGDGPQTRKSIILINRSYNLVKDTYPGQWTLQLVNEFTNATHHFQKV